MKESLTLIFYNTDSSKVIESGYKYKLETDLLSKGKGYNSSSDKSDFKVKNSLKRKKELSNIDKKK